MQTIAQIVCIWLLLYSLSIHSSFYLIFVLSRGNLCKISRFLCLQKYEKSLYYGKHGALANNFDTTLPATEALEVKSLLKDPYIFDMLTFTDQYDERDIEIGLIKHVEKFLVEMGAGFAFMGRQCMHSLLLQNKHFIYEYNDRQFFF